jgi:4-amino-4-deoxy-L-arabinose transferase-like glycosyltransferase
VSLAFLGGRELASSHEARAAQEAQRILDVGQFLPARLFDDQPDYQKPPLYYALVAASAWMHGGRVTAWDVRLPSFLAAAGCVGLVGGWLVARGRPVAGVVAAASLATMHHFAWLSQVGRIDPPLTLAVTVAVLGLALTPRRFPSLLAFLALAVGVLLKGPVAVVLLVLVLSAVALVERSARPLGPLLWGLPLVVLLAGPWFVACEWHTGGEFARVFFGKHHLARALGGEDGPHADSPHPWWYYGPRLAADLLPWTPIVVTVLAAWLRAGRWREDSEGRLGLAWALAVVLFLSCVRFKRADYLLPAYPGVALAFGCAAEWFWCSWGEVARRRAATALAGTVLACAGGWLVWHAGGWSEDPDAREARTFAAEVRRHCPAPQQVLFFRVEAHALAWHLGRPQNTFREWENLDVWAGRPGSHYILMTPRDADEWPRHVHSGWLEEVARGGHGPGHGGGPVVLLRTRPHSNEVAADVRRPDARRGETAAGRP